MSKTILITGTGSGFGEGAAIGLAKKGHQVIATCQLSPQVTQLRRLAGELDLGNNLRVEGLDLLDPYDVAQAQRWDIDVLFNNAGIGECGPVSEIPLDLVRRNFETNVCHPTASGELFSCASLQFFDQVRAERTRTRASACQKVRRERVRRYLECGLHVHGFARAVCEGPAGARPERWQPGVCVARASGAAHAGRLRLRR